MFKRVCGLQKDLPIVAPNVATDVAMGAKIPAEELALCIAQSIAEACEEDGQWVQCAATKLPAVEFEQDEGAALHPICLQLAERNCAISGAS